MDCKNFRDRIFLLQADELAREEREACQAHLDACPSCARLLDAEDAMLRTLRAKLPREPAPPGLDTRVRAALRDAAGSRPRAPWYRASWLAAAAAAALLIVLVVPTLRFEPGPADGGAWEEVHEEVLVVDLDCDRAGYGIEAQRGCGHPLHVNALKTRGGAHWAISPEPSEFRGLLLDREARGQRYVVDGRLYREDGTIRLRAAERVRARRIGPPETPRMARTARLPRAPIAAAAGG